MADATVQRKLVDHVQDAHAMEQTVSTMLDSMIATTDEPDIEEMLKQHKRQTQEHERRLSERLDAMGAGTSTSKSVGGWGAALLKGVGEVACLNRSDEEAMAKKIDSNWDKVLDLTLAEPGLLGQ